MTTFIDKKFKDYGLEDFDKFAQLINKCAYDPELYRLLPYLLRNLFENLLFYLFRDGLNNRHKSLYYNRNLRRSEDFSKLINLLNILREDPDFQIYSIKLITEQTITYLKSIQKEGNIDVHRVITQILSNYADDKKEQVNVLLDALLPLYKKLNSKSLVIINSITHAKIVKKLNLQKDIISGNVRDIIEDIKNMNESEMSDLIIDLNFEKLFEIVKKIIAEIIIIKEFDFDSDVDKIVPLLNKFIIYSIKIKSSQEKKEKLFSKTIDSLRSSNNDYKFRKIYKALPKLLEVNNLSKYCIENHYIPFFIELLCRSTSFKEATLNAEIISKVSSGLKKKDMTTIIECVLKNDQIYGSNRGSRIITDLFLRNQNLFDFKYNEKLKKIGMGIPDNLIL